MVIGPISAPKIMFQRPSSLGRFLFVTEFTHDRFH